MPFDRDKHHRRSIRLRGYDYAQPGAYFITICTFERAGLFGEVCDGEMRANAFGQVAAGEWQKTAAMRPRIRLDAFIVMPNHIHGIIVIEDAVHRSVNRAAAPGFGERAEVHTPRPESDSIPTIVRLYKAATTKRINASRDLPGVPVWQRNYYERIVRDENEYHRICEYIANNPARWADDQENPQR